MEVDDILRNFDQEVQSKAPKDSGDLYTQLTHAMLNERMCPELLPYDHNLLQQVLDNISSQQQFLLDSHEYGDVNVDSGIITSDFKLQLMIVETDIERLSYLVRLYFRIRLSKIENFTIYYIRLTSEDGDNKVNLLSKEEQDYLYKYMNIIQSLFNNSVLKKVPKELSYLDDQNGDLSMVTTPDVDELVFVKVETSKEITILYEDDEMILTQDGIYVVKYSLISKYLEIGDVRLI